MPNIKSAIKTVSVIEKKTLRNNMIKSGYRTAVKKFEEAVEAGDKANAEKCNSLLSRAKSAEQSARLGYSVSVCVSPLLPSLLYMITPVWGIK